MFLFLRIFFTVLSALCAAAVLLLGSLLGWLYALIAAGAALAFFGLMLFFKGKQEEAAPKEDEKDFLSPSDPSDKKEK